jgi:hypothetical protein
MGMLFLGPFLRHLDAGAPLVILSGGHVGCLELFVHEPIHSVRDLKGRSVAVVALGASRLRRDNLSSIAYSEKLNSSTISATLQSTDRHHGIVGQKRSHFQLDS